MRVLLLKVAKNNQVKSKITPAPPLGILYLVSYLRKFRGDHVKIYDMRLELRKNRQDAILYRMLTDFTPQVVGLSFLSYDFQAAENVSAFIKKILPGVLIVAGGPHPSMYPRRTLSDQNIDFIIRGEGEETFSQLLTAIENKSATNEIAGLGGRRNNSIFLNPQSFNTNLDRLPMPAWDLYDHHLYAKFDIRLTHIHNYQPYATIITSRGCPFHCIYCHSIFGKHLRTRSVENVMAELEYLKSCGIESIEILDDAFNVDSDHMCRILRAVIAAKLNLKLSFPNGLRVDLLTNANLELIKAAGCFYLSVAIETASPRIQKLIRKNLNLDQAMKNIHNSVNLHIFTTGFFMLGFPTETRVEMQNTINFACRSPLHSAFFFSVVPQYGTELGCMVGINELEAPIEKWDFEFGLCNISKEPEWVVNQMQRSAYRQFYFNPRRILRVARDSISWKTGGFLLRGLLSHAFSNFCPNNK